MNDPAAQAEPDNKVFKVGGGDQHHGLTDAVIGNRKGDFFRQGCFSNAAVVERDVVIRLAGRWRGRCCGGRRAQGALGVHRALPTGDLTLSLGATLCRV